MPSSMSFPSNVRHGFFYGAKHRKDEAHGAASAQLPPAVEENILRNVLLKNYGASNWEEKVADHGNIWKNYGNIWKNTKEYLTNNMINIAVTHWLCLKMSPRNQPKNVLAITKRDWRRYVHSI